MDGACQTVRRGCGLFHAGSGECRSQTPSPSALAAVRRSMWHTEHGHKLMQLGFLLALGFVFSYDVDRTMKQKPMTPEQTQQLQAWLKERGSTDK